jgi:hyperosmotically inducible protein
MKTIKFIAAAATALSLLGLAGCSAITGKQDTTRRDVGQYTGDAAITTKVKAAIAQDPEAKATEVKVDTYKGVVQLSGFVYSQDAANRAVQVARSIDGVKSVENKMSIKPATDSK